MHCVANNLRKALPGNILGMVWLVKCRHPMLLTVGSGATSKTRLARLRLKMEMIQYYIRVEARDSRYIPEKVLFVMTARAYNSTSGIYLGLHQLVVRQAIHNSMFHNAV